MIVLALTVCAVALLALFVTTQRARTAAHDAITAVAATRRELRPALVLARDDAHRAAAIRLPHQR